jgi:Asp-tRNA(Asn)/Glu-tRNA(Gln) amidotransferase A subunit family amidase
MIDYSIPQNITGFPAGIVPITKVLPSEQKFTDKYNDHWTRVLHQDAKDSAGMPICIQLIGYAFEDEKLLGLMKVLADKVDY